MKLFLKGTKCFSEKCAVEKRNFAPGQHGKDKKTKIVGYGLQLREKQKTKRMFFVQEGQFRNYFEKAARRQGVTGEVLLQQLECRLDNIVYRMGFAMSRRQARQLVRHGHISINGRKVNIPSYQVNVGEEISVRDRSREMSGLLAAKEFNSHQTPPTWMNIDREAFKGSVTQIPKRGEINVPVNEQLIVELYSK